MTLSILLGLGFIGIFAYFYFGPESEASEHTQRPDAEKLFGRFPR